MPQYMYQNPKTGEITLHKRRGYHHKDGTYLVFIGEAYSSSYGFCPKCGSPCKTRERRIDGNDTCENGCVYPSKTAIHKE